MSEIDNEHYRSVWTYMMRTPFEQRWIMVDDVETRYVDAGPKNASVVVMLHGTAGSWETFCANIPALSRNFRCLALDMIGCGFSGKPNRDYEIKAYVRHVLRFMDALAVPRASMIGVSLGAWIASQLALDAPSRVDKLILLSAAGLLSNAANMGRIKSQRSEAVDNPTWDSIRTVMQGLVLKKENQIDDMLAIRQAVYRQPEMKQAMRHILVLQDPDIRARNNISETDWRRIEAPTLIVLTPDKRDIYLEMGRTISELIPDARTVEIHNAAHWAHFEAPSTFNATALAFLSTDGVSQT